MALQHFYSRVPARMSIFNRTDSYDTFAYSEELDRTFIEKELSAVYDNKPSKSDAVLIRNGELPPIYCQYFTKSGVFTQGCISFIPLDYTGERSAFLVHSLIPDSDEENVLINSFDNNLLNKDMFKTDLSEFSLTSLDCTPCSNYPALEYKHCKAVKTDILLSYDSAMIKRLIFCMLNIACGKGKNVFISLPNPISEFSDKSLEFINTLLQIFPFNLRRAFSFVTYTDEASRFPAFNIRFIPEHSPEVPISKGITLHFGSKFAVGLSDELVASNNQLVDFFYGLLKNDATRREFLYFMDKAVKLVPELNKTNMKTLTELVFLFQQCSGLYNEAVILPNDAKMYDFVCAYDKHRKALTDEYRAVAFKCLKRYPDNHEAIPKDVFSKLSKIYTTEPDVSKHNIMDVVLELIHTDVMRDKLFNFIKSNYPNENEEIRSIICKDLCRVYYGGFLQLQILGFFEQNFSSEPALSKDAIIEKLLLTIRTPSVKNKILEFFDNNYDLLTENQKQQLFSTFYEMLPECDELAQSMISLINNHIENEPEDKKEELEKKLFALVEKDQKRKEPKLLGMLINTLGYCANLVTKQIFNEHSTKKIFESYVEFFYKLPSDRRLQLFEDIWKTVPDMSKETAERWADILIKLYQNDLENSNRDLYSVVEADSAVSAHLNGGNAEKVFCEKVLDNLIRPSICKLLPQAFSVKQRRDGLPFIIEYTSDKDFIKSCDNYKYINAYLKMSKAVTDKNITDMINACNELSQKVIRTGSAEHLKTEFLDSDKLIGEQYNETRMMLEILISLMKTGEADFITPYKSLVTVLSSAIRAENPKTKPEAVTQISSKTSMEYLLKCANTLYTSPLFEDNNSKIVETASTFAKTITSFVSSQKKGAKFINEQLSISDFDNDFAQKVKTLANGVTSSSDGFIKKLFSKK